MSLPINPLLKNLDHELLEVAGRQALLNSDLMFLHLRDSRELVRACGGPGKQDGSNKVLAKGAIVLAAAALEANLVHLTSIAEKFAQARPSLFATPQLEYIRGKRTTVDEQGNIVTRKVKSSLEHRLRVLPDLLAKAVNRRYVLPEHSVVIRKLRRTIERRDAIVHPRWDRYLMQAGWYEAAEAVDAVELYLESVQLQLHPYLAGYFAMLGTIPPGRHKHDGTDVGYRTRGRRGRHAFSKMSDLKIVDVIVSEWADAMMITRFALESGVEGDSDGSLLSRAAIILLYGMLDAQLGIIAQWHIAEDGSRFEEAESNFLQEAAVGIGHDGEIAITEDRQSFKQRIIAIPRILSRRVERKDIQLNLEPLWGKQLIEGNNTRNKLIHSALGEPIPRVTLIELLKAANAIKQYFAELSVASPKVFGVFKVVLGKFQLPSESEVSKKLSLVHESRDKQGIDGPFIFE